MPLPVTALCKVLELIDQECGLDSPMSDEEALEYLTRLRGVLDVRIESVRRATQDVS